jgi:Hg(II)-responsive transcriptional regulator
MAAIRTGELARQAGVGVETLRFYERQGLLPEPPRRASGYRDYPPESVGLVRFIRRAQAIGFTLKEVRDLLALREIPRATCGDVVALARHKLTEIDAKLADLHSMRAALAGLLEGCTGTPPIARCPIIESLAGEDAPPASRRRRAGKGGQDGGACCGKAERPA